MSCLASPGDFICLSLASGFVQLRFDLGDGVRSLTSADRVDALGGRWHAVRAGRIGRRAFLSLDGKEVKEDGTEGMSTLDVATEVFVGGVSALSLVSADATEGEPVGFTGGLREVAVNGEEFELTESGAVSGANVGDWDGTACGYKVCQNGGRCTPVGSDAFTCTCPPPWTGSVCNRSVACVNNVCGRGSRCVPSNVTSYRCVCPLGRGGPYCDSEVATDTLRFEGSSYVKYNDPRYKARNLRLAQVSFSFLARSRDGLIMWAGKAEHEDDDYLAAGLEGGRLKIAVNLGERLAPPVTVANLTLCCGKWHDVTLSLSSTVIQVFHNGRRALDQNLDPFERYVALNYGGRLYLGGFELSRKITVVTSGLFSRGFEGKVKNVHLFKDPTPLLFLKDTEGFNVFEDDEQ